MSMQGLVGDKYGPGSVPLALSAEEWAHVRQAAVEAGKDGRGMEEHFRVDSNQEGPVYAFSGSRGKRLDERIRQTLQESLQCKSILEVGASTAHKDGHINMVNASLQNRFFVSALEDLVTGMLGSKDLASRSLILQRRFQGAWAEAAARPKNGTSPAKAAANHIVLEAPQDDPAGIVDAPKRLASLHNHVSATLRPSQIHVARIQLDQRSSDYSAWRASREHDKYLEGLGRSLSRQLKDLLAPELRKARSPVAKQASALPLSPSQRSLLDSLYKESLAHLHTLNKRRVKHFVGQKSALSSLKDALKDGGKKKGTLVLLEGGPCSGKSTLLAEMGAQAKTWLGGTVVVAPRFAALTPASLHSHQIFQSIAAQVSLAYQLSDDGIKEAQDSLSVNAWLGGIFDQVSASKTPLLILLDDVHLIKHDVGGGRSQRAAGGGSTAESSFFGCLSNLPSGVTVVASCLAASSELALHALTGRKRESKSTVSVGSFSESELLEMFRKELSERRRKVSSEQEAWVRQRLKDTASPFMAHMLAVEALAWPSWQALSADAQANGGGSVKGKAAKNSLHSVLDWKLVALEREFGAEKVAALCRYLECSNYGLTECELLDVLSANRQLHQRLARDWLASPTSSRVVRFPPRIWLGVKRSLGALLSSTTFDDRHVYWWSHQAVSSAVRARYLTTNAQIKLCQKDLADLFLDYWSELGGFGISANLPSMSPRAPQAPPPKPAVKLPNIHEPLNGKGAAAAKLANGKGAEIQPKDRPPSAPTDGSKGAASGRPASSMQLTLLQTFPQPLRYTAGEEPLFNVRRLRNLWYHLLHSGSIEGLKDAAVCNFAYLDGLLHSCGLAHLLSVFLDIQQQVLNHDVGCLLDSVLLPAAATLREDRDQLAAEFISRLRYTRDHNSDYLNRMVEQAMVWVDSHTHGALLVPLTYWLPPPRTPLALSFSLKEHFAPTSRTVLQPTLNHQHLLVSGQREGKGAVETNGLILMFHVASSTLVRSFSGHTEAVTALLLAKSGQSFYSASLDGSVRLWDLLDGRQTRAHRPHQKAILCAALTMDEEQLITGSADSTARVSRLEGGEWKVVRTFPDHSGPVGSIALTQHSEFLITGSGDFMVRVWNMESGALVSKLGSLMAPVTCLTLTSNDAFVLVGCEDETLRVFSLVSGTELHELRGHESRVLSLAAAANDCQVFAGCEDGKIFSYDLHTADIVEIFHPAPPPPAQSGGLKLGKGKGPKPQVVNSLKITPDNWFLVSGTGELVHVWNVEPSGGASPTSLSHGQPSARGSALSGMALSLDGKYAGCGTGAGAVALWDLDVVQCVWTSIHEPPEPVSALAFNRDPTCLASATTAGHVALWSMGSGNLLRQLHGHNAPVLHLKVTNDNFRLMSHDSSGLLCVWGLNPPDEADFELVASLQGPSKLLAFSTNDQTLLARNGDNPKELCLYALGAEGVGLRARLAHSEEVSCLALSRTGHSAVTGSKDRSLKVWNAHTGYLTQVLVGEGHGAVERCGVSEDGRTVVSSAAEGLVWVWEAETGRPTRTFPEHRAKPGEKRLLTGLALCADGSVALSADSLGWVLAWGTETGSVLSRLSAHMGVVELAVSADAHRVLLRLAHCPHLPVLCLHNSPASIPQPPAAHAHGHEGQGASRRRASQISQISASSFGSDASIASAGATQATMSSPRPQQAGAPAKESSTVFHRLERNRSRASIYGDSKEDKSPRGPNGLGSQGNLNGGKAGKSGAILEPSAKSKLCTIL